ncbi:hypothetical protein B5E77_05225 [Lachnoclostridium sp. An131]|uniref:hypothetical protein n=1 Tax=Lachnoclostridium sp. An131 TaxID=1965555 RepID=UPI000B38CDC0|nr:hypothetical protein [Lachnoclostridium sp. An131]OUQ27756.1 hypothetical protein B5E77_05225 [Lachnoclostridium sp. An131]
MKQRGWNRDKMKNIVPFCRQRQKGAFLRARLMGKRIASRAKAWRFAAASRKTKKRVKRKSKKERTQT